MKKIWSALFVVGFLLMSMGMVYAQPEPVRLVEMVRKPGINFRQYKSIGSEISVSVKPNSDWAIDKRDTFLEQRVQGLTMKAARNQGWLPADNEFGDVRISVKILEWGRLRNTEDQNLMEFVTFELKAYSNTSEGPVLVFRGNGKYRRVDPVETGLEKVADVYGSMMEELMAALHTN